MNSVLADELQIWGLENGFMLYSDASLGFALALTPIDVSCWTHERINATGERVAQLLNGLPEGTDLQFVQEITQGSEARLAAHHQLVAKAADPLAIELRDARVKQFRAFDQAGKAPTHGLKLIVRRPMTGPLVNKPGLFGRAQLFHRLADERLSREIATVETFREGLMTELAALGLAPRCLGADEILDGLYEQWNPVRGVPRGSIDSEDVRSALLFTDAVIDERGFGLGTMKHRVLSLKQLPDLTFTSQAALLRDLPFDSKVFVSVHVPNQLKEVEALQTQRRFAFSMARGKTVGAADLDSEAKLHDLETLLEKLIAQGEKVFQVSFNVLLRAESEDELDRQVAQTLMLIREMSGAEAMEETVAAFPIFSEFALPNARAPERTRRIKTSNLKDLLPLYGPWDGVGGASVLLRSRFGNLIGFDPFSPELPNANQLISGGSGSGKSFLTNLLVLQMLKENPRVFIVDIGGSYQKVCENLGGQYLPLGIDSTIAFNPFDLPPGESQPGPAKIKFLVGLVELMTKEDGSSRIPRLDRAEIEAAIERVYREEAHPRLSNLRKVLEEHPHPDIRRYGVILKSWCGETAFGRFFDRESSVSLEKSVVAFDLKGMAAYPDLQAVGLYIITDFVWREVQKERDRKKLFILDEAWAQLKVQAGVDLIEETFRTMRKYNTSAIAISQDIGDFSNSAIAGAILPNCSIKWLLLQQQFDPSRMKDALGLNEREIAQVASLHQEKGVFSEAFLMTQDKRGVVVIESTPLEYWIATTDPRDLTAIEKAATARPGATRLEILRGLAQKYPHGASGIQVLEKKAGAA